MNKQQLAAKIWASANKLRSKIEANEYKDYILGFIFYKFLSDKEVKYLKLLGYTDDDINTVTEEDSETVENVQKNIGYFISYENLFSTWIEMKDDFDVSNVRDALSAFSRLINPSHKKVFDKIFETLQTGLSKLGESAASQTKAISDLIHLIKDIPMDGKQDYDVLGFIYEYLISNFAANAGKKAGEFYTPYEVSLLMSEIVADHLKDKNEIKIYDPTSGSGSLLINIGKAVAKHMGDSNRIKYYAQELKENTYNLTRMNLVMRGILPDNIVVRNGDTLEEDWPYFEEGHPETYEPLYVDAVVSNPPYSQHWDPSDKENDPRYSRFGLAPSSKADYAFLLHDLYHLKSDGIMTIVLPHGVLFRGGTEGEIRTNLIENNHIDAIIGLPANIFFGTGIPTIIMVLKQKRDRDDVLIVDASKGFEKIGKNNKLRASDIKRIVDAVTNREEISGFSKVVSRKDIRENDFNLNIPRYVDSSEKAESWDIYATMFGGIPNNELDDLNSYWAVFPELRDGLFMAVNEDYSDFKTESIRDCIGKSSGVDAFKKQFASAFDGFDDFLRKELLDDTAGISVSSEERVIADEIFKRLSGVPLIDKYAAYQLLDDAWKKIAVDIEIIQTEGFEATKIVDPHMIIKKDKNKKDVEVQDGWVGRILPFDLVQSHYFGSEIASVQEDERSLQEAESLCEELLESLPEDELGKDFVKEDNDGFVWAEVKKAIKDKTVDNDVLEILVKADETNKLCSKLKKQIKVKNEALHLDTKTKIESLTNEQVYDLLFDLWVTPLKRDILRMPEQIIQDLYSKLDKLDSKYKVTFSDVEGQIEESEKELIKMLAQLNGSDSDISGIKELRRLLVEDFDE